MRTPPRSAAQAVSDDEIRGLLHRYRCPVRFHAVRTRFLGSIASPGLAVAPLESVKALWGGELPEFDSLDAVNELLAVLVMGLWNQLGRHQNRRFPFRLLRADIAPTMEGLAHLALIRREELGGFVEGLFGKADSLELPDRADRALEVLSESRAFFDAMHDLATDPAKVATADEIAQTIVNVRNLSRIAEHEIHEAVLSCTRARRQMLELMSVARPTVH